MRTPPYDERAFARIPGRGFRTRFQRAKYSMSMLLFRELWWEWLLRAEPAWRDVRAPGWKAQRCPGAVRRPQGAQSVVTEHIDGATDRRRPRAAPTRRPILASNPLSRSMLKRPTPLRTQAGAQLHP